MPKPEQDLNQHEHSQSRDEALEAVRAGRVIAMMKEIYDKGESFSFDSKVSFSDVIEALDSDIDGALHKLWSHGDKGEDLVMQITEKVGELCWLAARNDITHESLKFERELSRAEDRAA